MQAANSSLNKYWTRYRHWPRVAFAGVLGFAVTLLAMEIFSTRALSLTPLSIALAAVSGALLGICLVGSLSAWGIRRKLASQNVQLDAALNNMIQGLCMFDAQNRLVVWNERYRAMYNIDPKHIRRGCTIRDLLDARVAAGTFPLDPARYDADLRAAVTRGSTFVVTVELADGRIIDVVNHPTKDGGWVAMHEDITERKKAERELEHTRAFLDTIVENVPSPIIVKDIPDLRYLLVNRAAEKYLGVDRTLLIGKNAAAVLPKASAQLIEAEDRKVLESGEIAFFDEHVVVTPGNGTRIATANRLPVKGPDGKLQYLISVIHDVTDRKRDEQRIAHMAHHDPLTDLPNRWLVVERLEEAILRAQRSQTRVAVLFIDLNRFKQVNDTLGHQAGDDLLKLVARRLRNCTRVTDTVGRLGGDEFLVVAPGASGREAGDRLAEKILYSMNELFRIRDERKEDYNYTISVNMLEIYNETIRDLLGDPKDANQPELKLRRGANGMFVENLTEWEVENEDDVIKAMDTGLGNRSVGQTDMNEHSSRSHSILTVKVVGQNTTAGITYFGKLHLIDLAGSERDMLDMLRGSQPKATLPGPELVVRESTRRMQR